MLLRDKDALSDSESCFAHSYLTADHLIFIPSIVPVWLSNGCKAVWAVYCPLRGVYSCDIPPAVWVSEYSTVC